MKKIILLMILFFGIMPIVKQGKLSLSNITCAYADDYGDEDGDGGDYGNYDDGNYGEPDYSGLYNSLSDIYDLNIVGVTYNADGDTLFILDDGSILDPNTTTITDSQIALIASTNPDLFPADIPLPSASDFDNLQFFLDYVTFLQQTNTSNADPCDVKLDVSTILAKSYPTSASMATEPGSYVGARVLSALDATFFSGFSITGTVQYSTAIPPGSSLLPNGQFNVPDGNGNMMPASGYTITVGSGSSAVSTIYLSPEVIVTGHNPDGIVAEMAHELAHAYISANNLTGVNDEYIAYKYQAFFFTAEGLTAKADRYAAIATAHKDADPNFDDVKNATVLANLPAIPANVKPCPK